MNSIDLNGVDIDFSIVKKAQHSSLLKKMVGMGGERSTFKALSAVTFKLESGDKVGVLGKNGSGKSTLLRVLAGVLPPSRGLVNINASVFPALTAAPGMIAGATCMQNIVLQGLRYGYSGARLKSYIQSAIDFSDLGDFVNSPYSNLSAGMKSRLAVSTLCGVMPQALIMDEWIGAADKSVLEKNNGLLSELTDRSDIFVLASHRRDVVEAHCSKAIVLDKGQVLFFGGLKEAYEVFNAQR